VRCQQTGVARVLVDGFRSQKVLQTQASDRALAFFKHKATGSASTELLAWNTVNPVFVNWFLQHSCIFVKPATNAWMMWLVKMEHYKSFQKNSRQSELCNELKLHYSCKLQGKSEL
jgi:hypothetical protein